MSKNTTYSEVKEMIRKREGWMPVSEISKRLKIKENVIHHWIKKSKEEEDPFKNCWLLFFWFLKQKEEKRRMIVRLLSLIEEEISTFSDEKLNYVSLKEIREIFYSKFKKIEKEYKKRIKESWCNEKVKENIIVFLANIKQQIERRLKKKDSFYL